MERLAGEFRCPETAIWQDLSKVSIEGTSQKDSKPDGIAPQMPRSKQERLYERILAAALYDLPVCAGLRKEDVEFFKSDNPHARLFLKIYENAEKFKKLSGASYEKFNAVHDPDIIKDLSMEERHMLSNLVFQEEVFPSFDADLEFAEEFNLCVQSLKKNVLHEKSIEIHAAMKVEPENYKLSEELQKISIELAKLTY